MARENGRTQNWLTAILAAGTLILATSSLIQNGMMKRTLDLYQNEIQSRQKPDIYLSISEAPGGLPTIGFDNVGQDKERWELNYYVQNLSDNPVYNLRYYHTLGKTPSFPVPPDSLLSDLWSDNIFMPNEIGRCGYDRMYRQEALDLLNEDTTNFRYFYVKYQDELHNVYAYSCVWRLASYEIGKHPEWSRITLRNYSRKTAN